MCCTGEVAKSLGSTILEREETSAISGEKYMDPEVKGE